MKTSELTGWGLNEAVAKCLGILYTCHHGEVVNRFGDPLLYNDDWSLAGEIIEREKISLEHLYGAGDAGADVWVATRVEGSSISEEQGSTALIAAMRCYVASKQGESE